MKKKTLLLPKQKRILRELGESIKLARLRRKLSTDQVSIRANISRKTLWAIENGSYLVHNSITGFSAIISPDGNFVEKADLMEKDVIYGEIYMMKDKTFYAKYGDILLYIYLVLSAIAAAAYFTWKGIRCRKSK